jgi:hypothetical protein
MARTVSSLIEKLYLTRFKNIEDILDSSPKICDVMDDALNEINSGTDGDYSGSLETIKDKYLKICDEASVCRDEIAALAKDIGKLKARFPAFSSNFDSAGSSAARHFERYNKLTRNLRALAEHMEAR